MQKEVKPTENNLAIASLVLGILSLVGAGPLAGIPAIITGSMSLKNPVNKGMGIAGLVMGIISVILTLLVVLFFMVMLVLSASFMNDGPETMERFDEPGSSTQRSI